VGRKDPKGGWDLEESWWWWRWEREKARGFGGLDVSAEVISFWVISGWPKRKGHWLTAALKCTTTARARWRIGERRTTRLLFLSTIHIQIHTHLKCGGYG
jgi:hypothetical protein